MSHVMPVNTLISAASAMSVRHHLNANQTLRWRNNWKWKCSST